MNWFKRPISNQTIGISATYGITGMLGATSIIKVSDAWDWSTGASFCAIVCFFIVISFITVLETFWMLDLEDEQTG